MQVIAGIKNYDGVGKGKDPGSSQVVGKAPRHEDIMERLELAGKAP